MEKITKLQVLYNGRSVGHLVDNNGEIAFQYDESWLENGFSISPIFLPLSSEIFINKKATFDGLFGVFHDSLPDGWGALLVARMLAKRGVNINTLSPLNKLALTSENGIGGLSYVPSERENGQFETANLDEIAVDIKNIYKNEYENYSLDRIYTLGGASGGARPKVHMNIDGESWIIKYQSKIDPENIGEQEYSANQTAQKCGINVNEYKLFPSTLTSGYFGAKRFDIVNGKRLHTISLSAVLEVSHQTPIVDYAHFIQVIKEICGNKEDVYEGFRRMCFNVLYGNKDDHSKNFAFIYNETAKTYQLSPFYDITKTHEKQEHEMTILGNGNPSETDIIALAKECKLNLLKCRKILEEVKKRIEMLK